MVTPSLWHSKSPTASAAATTPAVTGRVVTPSLWHSKSPTAAMATTATTVLSGGGDGGRSYVSARDSNPGIPNPGIPAHFLNPESQDWRCFNPGISGL